MNENFFNEYNIVFTVPRACVFSKNRNISFPLVQLPLFDFIVLHIYCLVFNVDG